ncbi:c-5 sterol desaturase [Mortierella sp. AD010]|nr:c-5 sterol desaturase [Mortierella sp. AD010]
MDVVLDIADEYVLNGVYQILPAIPIPDLVAALAAIPKWSDLNTLLSSTSSSPLHTIATIGRNVASAALSSNMTLNALPTDNILRQTLSLLVLTYLGALVMYFSMSVPSYFFVFDRNHMKHPKFLKNQIRLEIQMSMKALPGIAIMTTPWLVGEVRGWSRLYTHIHSKDALLNAVTCNPPTSVIQETVAAAVATATGYNSTVAAAAAAAAASSVTAARAAKLGPLAPIVEPFMDGWGYVAISVVAFLLFTDWGIYWIHRFLHHPLLYKRLHKKFVYLALFVLVNFWSVLIHDGEYLVSNPVVNSAAHHAVHHLYFNYNYGQYSTLWDRIGGSYRKPEDSMYDPTLRMDKSVWKKQAKDVDNFDDNGKPTAASDATFKGGPHAKGTMTTKAL